MSPAPSQTSTQAPTNRNLLFLTLGYACFVVACTQSFIPSGFSDSATESLEYRIANNVAFAAAYLVIALATLRRSSKRLPLAVPVAAGALVIVTQVLFFLCNEGLLELSAALVSVLHAATGSAMALLFSFWVSCAYLFDSRQFRYGILSGSLLSCFVVIFASGSNSAPAILSSQVIGLVISTTFAVTLSQDDSGHASSQKRNTGPRANVRDAQTGRKTNAQGRVRLPR